ncbi:hypothetical protein K488DRAFT_85657 [Vararia minispora EC-137]|uniref:Uncharacterized protein n=1 Tax=Vararia minispora EC-137 TaxID=1314806 RepID=A0ACB8QLH7_9AGAM|nr:hypothetical protein K488DRAFT_85657 [Vararia minispora EC-137]
MSGDDGHQKKSVLITGCSTGGIGHALALEFQLQGFYVIATARDPKKMQDLIDHRLIETVQLDVCNPASIRIAREEVERLLDGTGLDILINNAGGDSTPQPAVEVDMNVAQATMDVNFFGIVRTTMEFAPLLIQSGAGRVVNISSAAGLMPIPYLSIYGAAKAAVNAYSDSLRVELEPFNVGVTTVITGSVANSKDRTKFELELTPSSRYHAGKPAYQEAMMKNAAQRLMPAAQYAKALVHEMMRRHPSRTMYLGEGAWYAWLMTSFAPRSWIHSLMVRMWGINDLKQSKKTA